jgi:hypothetical protein
MRWPTISEAWTYRDPQEIADALIGRSARLGRGPSSPAPSMCAPSTIRDRYYRQARRLHVRQAMKGHR